VRRLAAGVWWLRPPKTAWGRARSRREEGLRTPPPPRPRQHRRPHPRLPSRGSRRCMIWTPSGTRASTSPSTALPTPPSSAPWRASSSSRMDMHCTRDIKKLWCVLLSKLTVSCTTMYQCRTIQIMLGLGGTDEELRQTMNSCFTVQ